MSLPDAVTDPPTQRNFEALDKRFEALLGDPPAVTGSRADPEEALAGALVALEALGLIDDQTGP